MRLAIMFSTGSSRLVHGVEVNPDTKEMAVNIQAGFAMVSSISAALLLAACARDTSAEVRPATPSYLGADIFVMGGARSQAEPPPVIEPTSSSKVISAIVFERVTGRTAYPGGATLEK